EDVAYYQALCATASGNPAKTSHPSAKYQTSHTVCDDTTGLTLAPTNVPGAATDPDANASIVLPDGIALQDEAFICGEQSAKAATPRPRGRGALSATTRPRARASGAG